MRKKTKTVKCNFSEEIEFPDVCVYCGKVNPDSTTYLNPDEENGTNGRMIVYAVPSCGSCAYAQKDSVRQIANLAFTFFLVVFTFVASYILKQYFTFIYIALAIFIITLFASIDTLRGIRKTITIESVCDDNITFGIIQKKYRELFKEMNKNLICGSDSDLESG